MEAFINYLKSKEMSQNTISSYSYAVSQFLSLYTTVNDESLLSHKDWLVSEFATKTAYCAVFATPFHAPLLQRSMADCHVAMRVALIARGAQAPLLANTAGYALSRCACALTRRLQYG